MSQEIEQRIRDEQWREARRLIEVELEQEPDNHWLLTRLALTYYEEHHYQQALELCERAFALKPDCPLVLWDYAGSLEMLDRTPEALAIYQRLINRGIDSLAYDECGEGRARARGLYADALYRMSHCHLALGERTSAMEALRGHLSQHGPGCRSIYPIRKARQELHSLR